VTLGYVLVITAAVEKQQVLRILSVRL